MAFSVGKDLDEISQLSRSVGVFAVDKGKVDIGVFNMAILVGVVQLPGTRSLNHLGEEVGTRGTILTADK